MILALSTGRILKYMFMPEIGGRIKGLIGNGFNTLAYYIALVYRAVNILPPGHPYTQRSNIGKYGVFNVLTEASSHLVFDRNNIDKVIVYFALLMGVFLLTFQFLLLLAAVMAGPAMAQSIPTSFQGFVTTANPDTDIAFRLLSQVFGIPDLFGSTVTAPTTFHTAIHTLFQFYSTGILVVAGLILSYFIFVVLAETAQTGTPFGRRFNHVWAPIRLVVAIGLLIPVSYGFNSAQWITLYAAKYGSGFATNGWITFNETLNSSNLTYLGDANNLVATPNAPEVRDFAMLMMLAKACRHGYYITTNGATQINVDAYLYKQSDGGGRVLASATSYDDALNFYNNGDIYIRFGEYNTAYSDQSGGVFPYCGELRLETTTIDTTSGAYGLNAAYYDLIVDIWNENNGYLNLQQYAAHFIDDAVDNTTPTFAAPPDSFRQNLLNILDTMMTGYINTAVQTAINQYQPNTTYEQQGWAGAGIWYNSIAEINGNLVQSAGNIPERKAFPYSMEHFRQQSLQNNESLSRGMFSQNLQDGEASAPLVYIDEKVNQGLADIYEYWQVGRVDDTGNVFMDIVNFFLGTKGLFDMCDNADIHPMAQLSGLGKGLIEAAVTNSIIALPTMALGSVGRAISSFLFTITSIIILIGFILFYLVPFLPFLYFFFAVGGWIKGLFEAMVGLPLWALAHIRIDGQGLPGDAAVNGYFLIFEIFIRPILIVFGLLASIVIFGAMIKVLNEIFYLATSNLAGFKDTTATGCGGGVSGTGGEAAVGSAEWVRGPVDEFFFTIVYAILVYMIAMSTFKLIDMIPNSILRWMGTGVNTYNDQAGETAEGLMQKVAVGGSLVGGQVQGAFSQLGGVGRGIAQGLSGR